VNYYDDYDLSEDGTDDAAYHTPPGVVSGYYPAESFEFVRGKLTAARVGMLNRTGTKSGPQWLNTYSFYDDFGRVIQTQADNHLGGHDTTWNQYNFPGWLLRTAGSTAPLSTTSCRN
jgi:hypothetical protein